VLHTAEFVAGAHAPSLNAMTIQVCYTRRLAATAAMRLAVLQDGADILLSAKPA